MKAMNGVSFELNEEQISRVSIPDKQISDYWLKIKDIVLEDKFVIRHYCFPSEKLWRVMQCGYL